jgi:ribose transport system permease protein
MAIDLAPPPTKPAAVSGFDIKRMLRMYSFAFAVILDLGLFIANLSSETGGFGTTQQLANLAPIAIAAMASVPAIIGGGFDFTISPLIFLTNCVFVVWLEPHGLGGAIAVPIMLALGALVGTLNGLLIVVLRVQSIVVTLAMYFILQGVDLEISSTPQSVKHSNWIQHLAGSVGPIPGAIFTIGTPVLIWFLLKYLPFRSMLYALGSNDTTTYSSGVRVNVVRIASYGLGGLFAGVGGLALTGLVSATNSSNATEYSLLAIAAVALGGTSLAGGRGGLIGGLLGAAAIYLLQNLLANLHVSPSYLQVIYGGMLVVAVVLGGRLAVNDGSGRFRRSMGRRTRLDKSGGSERVVESLDTIEVEKAAPRQLTFLQRLRALQNRFPLLQVVALIVIFIYGDSTLPGLDSWANIRTLLVIAALVGLASAGQTLLILIGGFDLGVAGFIVASALTVSALGPKYHIPFAVSLLIAVVGTAILGGIAGQVCFRYNINPLVVTLAMGTIAVGAVQILNGGLTTGGAPTWLTELTYPTSKTFSIGFPPTVAIWIAVIILFAIFLYRTPIGRNLMATGSNSRAAGYALINTRRVWVLTFAFSAAASALVGVLIAGYAGNVAGNLGDPYLFQSVVAVIVGGTIFGGPGDYTRTCVGALFLTVLTTVLIGHGASAAAQQIIYGVIILVSITIYGRQRALRDRL